MVCEDFRGCLGFGVLVGGLITYWATIFYSVLFRGENDIKEKL